MNENDLTPERRSYNRKMKGESIDNLDQISKLYEKLSGVAPDTLNQEKLKELSCLSQEILKEVLAKTKGY